jgi:hypothetical protein
VVVDLTNKATIDMANVWKQTVLNKLTRLVPTEISNNGEQLQEVPVSPVNFPVLLLGNKFDIVSYFNIPLVILLLSCDIFHTLTLSLLHRKQYFHIFKYDTYSN